MSVRLSVCIYTFVFPTCFRPFVCLLTCLFLIISLVEIILKIFKDRNETRLQILDFNNSVMGCTMTFSPTLSNHPKKDVCLDVELYTVADTSAMTSKQLQRKSTRDHRRKNNKKLKTKREICLRPAETKARRKSRRAFFFFFLLFTSLLIIHRCCHQLNGAFLW